MKAKLTLAVLAVLAAMAAWAAPSAVAQTANAAVSDWSSFCLATFGEQNAAFERATAAGWRPFPKLEKTARYLEDAKGRRTLMFQGPAPGPVGTKICMTSAPVAPGASVHVALDALLGHPRTYQDGAWQVWAFEREGNAFSWRSNDDVEGAREIFANGRAVVVRAGVENGFDIVMYEFKPK
jgi:hypothetical protein